MLPILKNVFLSTLTYLVEMIYLLKYSIVGCLKQNIF